MDASCTKGAELISLASDRLGLEDKGRQKGREKSTE